MDIHHQDFCAAEGIFSPFVSFLVLIPEFIFAFSLKMRPQVLYSVSKSFSPRVCEQLIHPAIFGLTQEQI
jgi:hypothetical protein